MSATAAATADAVAKGEKVRWYRCKLSREDMAPKVAVGVAVEEAFLHCAKAFKRSALWRPDEWPDRAGLASAAQIWRDHMALDMTTQDIQDFVDDDYANNLTWR